MLAFLAADQECHLWGRRTWLSVIRQRLLQRRRGGWHFPIQTQGTRDMEGSGRREPPLPECPVHWVLAGGIGVPSRG